MCYISISMFSYLFVISCICIYVYTHIDIYIYMCCFVSCQWYLPVIKNYNQQSEKAMKEKRFNKSSTISIDIALRKKLIGNDKNNREKKSMLSV